MLRPARKHTECPGGLLLCHRRLRSFLMLTLMPRSKRNRPRRPRVQPKRESEIQRVAIVVTSDAQLTETLQR